MSSGPVTGAFVPEQRVAAPRANYTVVAYLSFEHKGAQASPEAHAYDRESQARLRALLRYVREHIDGVRSVRVLKHSLGGLNPTGRGIAVTHVMVEITRLYVFDRFCVLAGQPGPLRDLVEGVRQRLRTYATEILYEVPLAQQRHE